MKEFTENVVADVQGLATKRVNENVSEKEQVVNKKVKCCLCGKEIEDWQTNNPFPISANGRCCSDCNSKIVIPLRLRLMRFDTKKED